MADIKQRVVIEAVDNTTRGMRTAQNKLNTLDRTLKRVQTTMLGFVGINIATNIVTGIAKASDSAVELDAKLRLLTDSTEDFNYASQELLEISLESGSALSANTILFTRMNKSIKSMGGTTQTTLDTTRALSQGLRISGASAQESSSVIRQWSQAMASGVLRGEEFNAVSENGARIIQALSEALDVSIGELREMSKEGVLTAETVTKALLSQSKKIAEENAKLPLTIGRAIENVNSKYTKWMQNLGESNKKVAGYFSSIADHFDGIANAIVGIGKATFVWYAAKSAIERASVATKEYNQRINQVREDKVALWKAQTARKAKDEAISKKKIENYNKEILKSDELAVAKMHEQAIVEDIIITEERAAKKKSESDAKAKIASEQKLKAKQAEKVAELDLTIEVTKRKVVEDELYITQLKSSSAKVRSSQIAIINAEQENWTTINSLELEQKKLVSQKKLARNNIQRATAKRKLIELEKQLQFAENERQLLRTNGLKLDRKSKSLKEDLKLAELDLTWSINDSTAAIKAKEVALKKEIDAIRKSTVANNLNSESEAKNAIAKKASTKASFDAATGASVSIASIGASSFKATPKVNILTGALTALSVKAKQLSAMSISGMVGKTLAGGMNIATIAVKGLKGALTKLLNIDVLFTAWMGWEFGKFLYAEFAWARKGGILLSGALLTLASGFEFLKDAIAAIFTGDTIADAFNRHTERVRKIVEIHEDLYEQAGLNENELAKVAEAADKKKVLSRSETITKFADLREKNRKEEELSLDMEVEYQKVLLREKYTNNEMYQSAVKDLENKNSSEKTQLIADNNALEIEEWNKYYEERLVLHNDANKELEKQEEDLREQIKWINIDYGQETVDALNGQLNKLKEKHKLHSDAIVAINKSKAEKIKKLSKSTLDALIKDANKLANIQDSATKRSIGVLEEYADFEREINGDKRASWQKNADAQTELRAVEKTLRDASIAERNGDFAEAARLNEKALSEAKSITQEQKNQTSEYEAGSWARVQAEQTVQQALELTKTASEGVSIASKELAKSATEGLEERKSQIEDHKKLIADLDILVNQDRSVDVGADTTKAFSEIGKIDKNLEKPRVMTVDVKYNDSRPDGVGSGGGTAQAAPQIKTAVASDEAIAIASGIDKTGNDSPSGTQDDPIIMKPSDQSEVDRINNEFNQGIKVVESTIPEKKEEPRQISENSWGDNTTQGFADGGFIPREDKVPGAGSGDTVKAMLTPGEFVMKKSAVQMYGEDLMHRLNSGVQRFAKGGIVVTEKGENDEQGLIEKAINKYMEVVAKRRTNGAKYFGSMQLGGGKNNLEATWAADVSPKVMGALEGLRGAKSLSKVNTFMNKINEARSAYMYDPVRYSGAGSSGGSTSRKKSPLKKQILSYLENSQIFKFAEGGNVYGSGLGDSVKALLTPGEFVIKKGAVQQFGSDFLNSINQGIMPQRFATGGMVGAGVSGSNDTIDININIGGASAKGTFAKGDATMAMIEELKRMGAGS